MAHEDALLERVAVCVVGRNGGRHLLGRGIYLLDDRQLHDRPLSALEEQASQPCGQKNTDEEDEHLRTWQRYCRHVPKYAMRPISLTVHSSTAQRTNPLRPHQSRRVHALT